MLRQKRNPKAHAQSKPQPKARRKAMSSSEEIAGVRPNELKGGALEEATRFAGGELAGAGNIDKIRDILFGVQMRDYEKKFGRLEDRLVKEATGLRDDLKRRFESLEAYIKKEVESLDDRLKAEHSERTEAVKELAQELKNLTKAFEKKTAQIDEQATKSQRELRDQILDQSKSLAEEIETKTDALSTQLAREVHELQKDKTDRTALATLLTEMAMRLNNEFRIPGND
jgi:DNA repair exonuclease SbcCD ATPase subunit